MNGRPRILAISGSLRAGATNRRLLEAARQLADGKPGSAKVEILSSDSIRALPHYDEDHEADPGVPVETLRSLIEEADGLLIATPEYNSSIPGALKNAVDWASRPRGEAALEGKPAVVVGASASPFGAVWAQAELRKVLGSAGARVLDAELALGQAASAFSDDGDLLDQGHTAQLEAALEALELEIQHNTEGALAAAA